jgi:hypothetical protein
MNTLWLNALILSFIMENASDSTKEPYLGDLQKTQIIDELFLAPQEKRDDEWKNTLLQNVADASFTCGNPQVIQGPDGFPYFQLLMPEPYKSFTCYVIKHMNDDFLLKQGVGAAIFKQNSKQPEWVFSYGDLLNYHLNKEFYSDLTRKNASTTEVLQEKEEILTGQPSEQFLPKVTRDLIRQMMEHNQIRDMKLLLMMRKKSGNMTQELVFNLEPGRFQNQEHFDAIMRAISWFLPRHYSFCAMKESSLEKSFEPL